MVVSWKQWIIFKKKKKIVSQSSKQIQFISPFKKGENIDAKKFSNKEIEEKFKHLVLKGWNLSEDKIYIQKPLYLKISKKHFPGCVELHL